MTTFSKRASWKEEEKKGEAIAKLIRRPEEKCIADHIKITKFI